MTLLSRLTTIAILLGALCATADPFPDAVAKLGGKSKESGGAVVEWAGDASKFTDAEWRVLGGCAKLKKLSLDGKALTDATLPLLAGLTDLEELSTNGSALTDDGYKGFAALKSLKSLALFHPSFGAPTFTGAGLAHLAACPKLDRLTFAGSTAGDPALDAIGTLTHLKQLHTWHTAQTPAGNANLLKLTDLRVLRMGQRLPKGPKPSPASLDDGTLAILAQVKSLESIELFEARLTAKAVAQLAALPNLAKLKIHQSELSPADVESLKAALPKVKVDFVPPTDKEREALSAKLKV